jgi:hypothetical protein
MMGLAEGGVYCAGADGKGGVGPEENWWVGGAIEQDGSGGAAGPGAKELEGPLKSELPNAGRWSGAPKG